MSRRKKFKDPIYSGPVYNVTFYETPCVGRRVSYTLLNAGGKERDFVESLELNATGWYTVYTRSGKRLQGGVCTFKP